LRDVGIKISGTFILGFPGETEETIRETIEFCKRNILPIYAFTLCCPLPGTRIYQLCLQNGRIRDEAVFWERLEAPLTELIINLTDFSDEELLRLKHEGEDEINTWAARCGRASIWD
jgi:radical SAM superfamily enzyme YgiQ (UPF0313 family)